MGKDTSQDIEGRRVDAAWLYEQAEDILINVGELQENMDPECLDPEKPDQAEKAIDIATRMQELLGDGADVPSEATLRKVREMLPEAQMHANEAKPPFPSH